MTKKNKIILYGGVTFLTISYIVYNRWEKRIFYDEILKRIGGGSVNFLDLKIWKSSFLNGLKSSGKRFAEYKQEIINEQAQKLNDAISGGGTDEEKIISVFRFFNSKVGIAQLVSFYNAKYSTDLKLDLQDELNDFWISKIGSIVSQKPDVIYI